MDISLRQLRSFLVVAKTRHFRLAAERLHLTQPAVSRHIADLEATLGVQLFDRNPRGAEPTAAGVRLQGSVTRVLDELDAVLAQARVEGEGLRGTVRIAAGPTPSAELIPDCLARCARTYPELRVLSRDRVQVEVMAAVLAGEVDFGVAIDPPPSAAFALETILRDPFVLVCRRDSALARLPRVPWRRLAGERLVLLDQTSGSRRLIDAALADFRVVAKVVQETGHTYTAFRMVEAGLGATVMPGLSAPLSRQLVVRPLTPRVRRAITLVRRTQHALSPAAAHVWALLREVAEARGRRPTAATRSG